jgi:cellulose synthase/poly-beta-1,6-N-acetylglucosamine synthase-like glycosyltransferase
MGSRVKKCVKRRLHSDYYFNMFTMHLPPGICFFMLLTILFILSALYALSILLFTVAALLARYPSNPGMRPSVSIIIAARNEAEDISRCLESLLALSYPRGLLEIIVVDDRSTDATPTIVRSYAERNPQLTLITAAPGTGHLQGKTNAVTQGIEASRGEILMFTDADCIVPHSWVEETVKYYTEESVGIVAGFTDLQGTRPFEEMQALDWYTLFSVAAATIRLNYPVTSVGNNLSVSRKAYDAVGGYRTIPFSVTEDYALFHAVTSAGPFRARFPMNEAALVQSRACGDLRQLHRQRLRWFTGGRDMDVKSLAMFVVPYVLNVMILFGGFFFPLQALFAAIGTKLCVDFALSLPALYKFKRLKLLRSFPLFELYYFFYVLLYPILVLLGQKVVWKERSF